MLVLRMDLPVDKMEIYQKVEVRLRFLLFLDLFKVHLHFQHFVSNPALPWL